MSPEKQVQDSERRVQIPKCGAVRGLAARKKKKKKKKKTKKKKKKKKKKNRGQGKDVLAWLIKVFSLKGKDKTDVIGHLEKDESTKGGKKFRVRRRKTLFCHQSWGNRC